MPLTISEEAFQRRLIRKAKRLGWTVYHIYDSRGTEAGFPDLVMRHLRHGVIVAELKSQTGRVELEQAQWLDAFQQMEVPSFTWRPSDWPLIQEILKGGV